MKFIKTDIQIIVDGHDTTIIVRAYLQDEMEGFTTNIKLTDSIKMDIGMSYENIFQAVKDKEANHPFFQLAKCESPIEIKFYVYALQKIPGLVPQIVVGPYRVDFAIPYKKVLIELDGHEFHKTKEQRTYDARRDRYLVRAGWYVMRFTGTEVYNDIIGTIEDAINTIKSLPKN